METKNNGNTAAQSKCEFLVKETVQSISHELCHNPEMLAINKGDPEKGLTCIGKLCRLY